MTQQPPNNENQHQPPQLLLSNTRGQRWCHIQNPQLCHITNPLNCDPIPTLPTATQRQIPTVAPTPNPSCDLTQNKRQLLWRKHQLSTESRWRRMLPQSYWHTRGIIRAPPRLVHPHVCPTLFPPIRYWCSAPKINITPMNGYSHPKCAVPILKNESGAALGKSIDTTRFLDFFKSQLRKKSNNVQRLWSMTIISIAQHNTNNGFATSIPYCST